MFSFSLKYHLAKAIFSTPVGCFGRSRDAAGILWAETNVVEHGEVSKMNCPAIHVIFKYIN